jgi:hypothetical protein
VAHAKVVDGELHLKFTTQGAQPLAKNIDGRVGHCRHLGWQLDRVLFGYLEGHRPFHAGSMHYVPQRLGVRVIQQRANRDIDRDWKGDMPRALSFVEVTIGGDGGLRQDEVPLNDEPITPPISQLEQRPRRVCGRVRLTSQRLITEDAAEVSSSQSHDRLIDHEKSSAFDLVKSERSIVQLIW